MSVTTQLLPWSDFLRLTTDPTGLAKRIDQDPEQKAAVQAGLGETLQLVAGPGTGKTTTLTLRLLKLVFVDGVPPNSIVATTFTKKAAGELRSRLLGWGDALKAAIRVAGLLGEETLARIDLNQVTTGTLDSLAEEIMSDFRVAGIETLTPVEDFIASAHMRIAGLFANRRYQDRDLAVYVQAMDGDRRPPGLRRKVSLARELRDRFLHDQIDVKRFRTAQSARFPGVGPLVDAVSDYETELAGRLLTDFAGIEAEFLARLKSGALSRFTRQLQVVLVDEYQDTNYLQERIYLCLAAHAVKNGGSITVVGDDDQSLYRFRGATVDLFTNFPVRIRSELGILTRTIPLSHNYRSTDAIVTWADSYINLDPSYKSIRAPGKSALRRSRVRIVNGRAVPPVNYPVIGMFRDTNQDLARDLAAFLDAVLTGPGFRLPDGKVVQVDAGGGPGDCALLCSSPSDYDSTGTKPRLPLLLRNELAGLGRPIRVFNPRGEEFAQVAAVRTLCGLLLECVDPTSTIQDSIQAIPPAIIQTLSNWRAAARVHISTDPTPPGSQPGTLPKFVASWQARQPQSRRGRWPRNVPLMQVLYQLLTWMPDVQGDAEGLLYVEALTRTIAAAATVSSYECNVFRDPPHSERSIREILRNVFEPIATGEAQIDEDLMEVFPTDRVSILSIHQAKGLEFPLVIVDVGSDFRTDHPSQRFKRFPDAGGRSQRMEDDLWPYSLGLTPPSRSALDRCFDDLIRQYFVAFTRPQDVLLLVGLGIDDSGSWAPRPVPNVATGWKRDRSWPWQNNPNLVLL